RELEMTVASAQVLEKANQLWWAIPAATLLVLLLLALLFGKGPEQTGKGTSYDASHQGFRAAYLLLEELGYPVARTKRPTGGTIRWVLSPTTGEDKAEQLDAWVRAGGILILADNTGDFADAIGIELKVHEREFEPGTEPASGPDIARLGGG